MNSDMSADTSAGLEHRRRRALFRASHRGTKEMDWLLGRYAAARLPAMAAAELAEFEALLALPDPQVQACLLAPATTAGTLAGSLGGGALIPLVGRLRAFHGLPTATAER